MRPGDRPGPAGRGEVAARGGVRALPRRIGRRSWSDRPLPTARASRSRRSSSCCRRRRRDRRARPSEVAAALRERLAGHPDGASVADRLAQFLGVGDASRRRHRVGGATTARGAGGRAARSSSCSRTRTGPRRRCSIWSTPSSIASTLRCSSCVSRGPSSSSSARPGQRASRVRSRRPCPPLSPDDTRRIAEILLGPQHPSFRRRADLRDGGGESALPRAVLGDARGPGPPRRRTMDGRRRCRGRGAGVAAGAPRGPARPPRSRGAPRPRARVDRGPAVPPRIAAGARSRAEHEASSRRAIASLDRSGLVLPEDEAGGRWRFAHALVLDAAYRGLSKGRRAELHERLADWLSVEDAEQADVGESVARHLERALHLREELGMRDERSAALAARAGELFAVGRIAGLRHARLHHDPRPARPRGRAPAGGGSAPARPAPQPRRRADRDGAP